MHRLCFNNQQSIYVLPVLTLQTRNFISRERNVNVKLHFQFFCPLFYSFLIYIFFYFIISFHRHCICLQHSILCLFMHFFLKFPCFHLTTSIIFLRQSLLFSFKFIDFFLVSLCHNFKHKFWRRMFSVQFSCLSHD